MTAEREHSLHLTCGALYKAAGVGESARADGEHSPDRENNSTKLRQATEVPDESGRRVDCVKHRGRRGKSSDVEFARFLHIALGSAHELEYHFIAARDVEAIRATDCAELTSQVIEVRRMIYGLLKRLEGDAD